MTPRSQHQPPRALGYLRVSTEKQASSGGGLAGQRTALETEAQRRGWDLELVEEDEAASGKNVNPALTEALARLDAHQADVLVTHKVDRVSRSMKDFTALLDRAQRRGWSLVCLDLGVDTTTPTGELQAHIVGSMAHYERRLIGQRTKDALAAKKAAGVRLGRPQTLPLEVVRRVVDARDSGSTWQSIADALVADGVPTARGGTTWRVSTVQAVYKSQAAEPFKRTVLSD